MFELSAKKHLHIGVLLFKRENLMGDETTLPSYGGRRFKEASSFRYAREPFFVEPRVC